MLWVVENLNTRSLFELLLKLPFLMKIVFVSVSGGNNYMDLSDMPMDKNQQTMMWQQNQYMDSGINSGATTQVR